MYKQVRNESRFWLNVVFHASDVKCLETGAFTFLNKFIHNVLISG